MIPRGASVVLERKRLLETTQTLSKKGNTSPVPGVFLQSFIKNMAIPNMPV
jgi:hypothetical protein